MVAITIKSKYSIILIIVSSIFQFNANAQNSILDKYINQAIESNAALKQKQLSYQKSLFALKEAKRMFFPKVSVVAEYAYNSGGITVDIPFGDMMNPAYDNLDLINTLNSAQNPAYPNIPKYPLIENAEVPFLFEEEQRTQIQFEMPLYNQALILNKKLQKQISEVKKISADSYKKELIKQVKSAYLDYKIAGQTLEVGNQALALVTASLAVSNSLYKNDKITVDEIYKAEAKVKEVESKIVEIHKGVTLTKAYFNFLLNKKFDAEIEMDDTFLKDHFLLQDINYLLETALKNRAELKLLDHSLLIDETNIKIEKGTAFPLLYLNGSAGYWSTDYSYNDKTQFSSISVAMKWDIFSSGQRSSKIQQAKFDKLITIEKRKELKNNISLEVVEAYYNVKTAQESVDLSKLETLKYKESFNIIERKKEQNLASQLEYDLIFTDFFEAQINYLKHKNQYFQKIIELAFIINQ